MEQKSKSRRIIYVPLEIIDSRYTGMMDDALIDAVINEGVRFYKAEGKNLTTEVAPGFFLDSCGTNYFKASQIMEIMRMFQSKAIKNGDVFLFSDLWFPGIEAIKYTAVLNGIDIKICGVMHAGTWTDTDWINRMEYWAKWIEMGWFKMFDRIFVGSEWHKSQILEKGRCVEQGKIFVTGNVFNTKFVQDMVPLRERTQFRDNLVLFPHRICDEKQPGMFDYMKSQFPDCVEFLKTQELGLPKLEYYKLMAEAKVAVSFALQENFGYWWAEAISLGTVPIAPNRLSYPEFLPQEYLYNDYDQCIRLIKEHLENPKPLDFSYVTKFDDVASKIVNLTLEV